MTTRFITAALLTAIPFTLFAQSPEAPSEETLKKASYAMGTSVAQQVANDPQNMVADQFLAGFQDAVGGEVDVKAKMSYAEGLRMALRLQNDQMGMDANEVLKGMQDAAAGGDLAYSQEELQAAMQELQQYARAQQQAQMEQQRAMQAQQAEQAESNLAEGEEFLKENAGKEGVMTTLSGLQYSVMEEGEGEKPSETDTVRVHYTGRLLDGTVFDSSIERGEPVEFPLNRVIPGWTEGLQLMSPGAKYRFWIPADLAYGQNAPPAIGPNQVLDFEVELLEVK